MTHEPHHDKEVVMLPRHKSRGETMMWLVFALSIAIVLTGWVLIVGKQLTIAIGSAKTGMVRAGEIPAQFRETTSESREGIADITELIVDEVRPYAEGAQQRKEVLDTVSGMMAGTLVETEGDSKSSTETLDQEQIGNE